jgi:hypothetical protein
MTFLELTLPSLAPPSFLPPPSAFCVSLFSL